MDSLFDKDNNKFYPENQEGNIEYKWRLDTKNELGYKKLISQMMWRINEGYELYGEKKAGYLIGIYDDGSLGELSVDQLIKSINIFKDLLKTIDVKIRDEEIKMINTSYIYYANIIKEDNIKINEKNLVIIGEQKSGKTTLISQMCYNSNIKNYVLKHVHEKISGTTTDIKKEIIGIKQNKIINYADYGGWDDIIYNSDIVINIYDIPVLNIKSIINYLLGIDPDYIIITYNNIIDKINKPDLKFYADFCQYYDIKYKFINYDSIKNYDKNIFNNILFDISKYNKNNTLIKSNSSIFRILDHYDIPEKGYIITGIQIENNFESDQNAFLIVGQNNYAIKIKSIHKKTIKCDKINQNESGSFNIELLNKNKLKITKNSYIINKNISNNNNYKIKLNKNNIINKMYNGTYDITIFNGNCCYEKNIKIIDNQFDILDIVLQDTKIIICIDNNIEFTNLILCKI
jgi:hypothetical protein